MTGPLPFEDVPEAPEPPTGYGAPTALPHARPAATDDVDRVPGQPHDTPPLDVLALPPDHEAVRNALIYGDPYETMTGEPEPEEEEAPEAPADPRSAFLPEGVTPDEARAALRAVYGDDFPLAADAPTEADWAAWPETLWTRHRGGMATVLHLAERNRLFRDGQQWVSAQGERGRWREPPAPKDTVRAVEDHIGPALDWRLQIMTEQRPGWSFEPVSADPDDKARAEAAQVAVEYQWKRQKMPRVFRGAGYWAGTDGVAFLYSHWDADAGPWAALPDGKGGQRPQPMGDVATRVYRIEQVRVSANATATEAPVYWVLRDVMATAEAVTAYGPGVLRAGGTGLGETPGMGGVSDLGRGTAMGVASVQELLRDQPTVDRFTVLCAPSEFLPQGLELVVVGRQTVAGPLPLRAGVVTISRVPDGSADPAFFPKPVMCRWIPPQQRVNAVLSKWIESVRLNAGGRFLTKQGTLVQETLVGGMFSALEVRTGGDLASAVQPLQGFALGEDAKELLQTQLKYIEDLTGFNDMARGAMSEDASGRAILARREQLERTFAPAVTAMAEAMSDWAEHQLAWMRYGYSLPRNIAVSGKGRRDLGRMIQSRDLDGTVDVTVDAETLMPKPRSLVLFELDDAFSKGVIGPKEYRERTSTASTRNWETPDEVQEAKGKRVAEALRTGQPPEPMVWQDDDAIMQDVLEKEIILQPDVDPMVMAGAQQRWMQHAQQALEKASVQQPPRNPLIPAYGPPPMAPPGMAPPGVPGAPPQSPAQHGAPHDGAPSSFQHLANAAPHAAPVAGSNPGVAAAPAAMLASRDDPSLNAQLFERMSPQ